ncbi:hypothetical protein NUACC21_00830 [Scytonema sp. NUACC21]
MRVDFPEPETPVTETSLPNGISTSMFLRLLRRAFLMTKLRPFPSLRVAGVAIARRPDK